ERIEKASAFAFLHFATDTADPTRGALLQKVEERSVAVSTQILFFELEWAAVPDGRVAELLDAPDLTRWRHFLEAARRFRPHLLSEPEEKTLTEKSVTARPAVVRLLLQVSDAVRVRLEDRAGP